MVIVDTTVWIEALRQKGDPAIKTRLGKLMAEDLARFCDPVLLELRNTSPRGQEKAKFESLVSLVPSFPTTSQSWKLAGEYAEKLRSKGVSVPALDILIRAIADENNAACLSLDSDFAKIEESLASE